MNPENKLRGVLIGITFGLLAVIAFGFLWLFFLAPAEQSSGFGWYLFAFAAGLSMIVLPCTLPLAFVIVPLSMGKGVVKGLGMALSFGLGIAATLSLYGVVAALVGDVALSALGADLETVKNWVYFIAGVFALFFALGEIGLLRFRMPTYTGAAPQGIQRRKDFLKAFLMGLFLGNIGVGCPHPATPLILVEIASSGDIFYGWLLFLTHAIGRVLPLLFLAFLGILGVNGLKWLTARREGVERFTGWAMVFVAGFILTLGLFTHKWWVNSGIHTQLEKLTGEEQLLNIVRTNLNSTVTHTHTQETGGGLFGLPLWLGNWFLVALWVVPIWWWWARERRRNKKILDEPKIGERTVATLILRARTAFFLSATVLLALIFIYILPHNFLEHDEHSTMSADHPNPQSTGTVQDRSLMAGGGAHTGHDSLFHEEETVLEGFVVNASVSPPSPIVGEQALLRFYANMKPSGIPVEDLEINHEKLIHVIGVRSDLSNFFHIHPESAGPGAWVLPYAFRESGTYKLWSDAKRDGATHSFGHPLISVSDGSSTTPPAPNIVPDFSQNVIVGDYQVEFLHKKTIAATRQTEITFIVRDLFGSGIHLESYLAVPMHLAIVSSDLKHYIHTHPEGEGHSHAQFDAAARNLVSVFVPRVLAHDPAGREEVDPVNFHIVFPEPGIYKLFAQFRPEGFVLPADQSLVAEFFVLVADKSVGGWSADFPKGAFVGLSILLMAALSYLVKIFLGRSKLKKP